MPCALEFYFCFLDHPPHAYLSGLGAHMWCKPSLPSPLPWLSAPALHLLEGEFERELILGCKMTTQRSLWPLRRCSGGLSGSNASGRWDIQGSSSDPEP